MFDIEKKWFKTAGASEGVISELKEIVQTELPTNFYKLLEFSNGGEGPLAIEPENFILDSAEEIIINIKESTFVEFFPEFLIFGGNGGGELIAFDFRKKSKLSIVRIDDTNIDLNESVVKIANDFNEFFTYVGKEITNA